jgi:hypothetical protein
MRRACRHSAPGIETRVGFEMSASSRGLTVPKSGRSRPPRPFCSVLNSIQGWRVPVEPALSHDGGLGLLHELLHETDTRVRRCQARSRLPARQRAREGNPSPVTSKSLGSLGSRRLQGSLPPYVLTGSWDRLRLQRSSVRSKWCSAASWLYTGRSAMANPCATPGIRSTTPRM